MASSGIGFLIYAPLALFLCDKTFIQLIALWFGSKVGHSPHMAFAGCRLLGVRMFPGKPGLNIPGRVAILGIMPQMPASALFPACRPGGKPGGVGAFHAGGIRVEQGLHGMGCGAWSAGEAHGPIGRMAGNRRHERCTGRAVYNIMLTGSLSNSSLY